MVNYKEQLAPFRATGTRDMYRLHFLLSNKMQKQVEVIENIDFYYGDLGENYAKNIIFRIGNEIVKGTDLEHIPWEKMKEENTISNREFAYGKKDRNGNCLLALAKFQKIDK